MSEIINLKPSNRHLLVVPHFKKNETDSGVLLPEDYNPKEERYIEATVIDVADDCSQQFKHLRYGTLHCNKIVIDRTMIEQINVSGKIHYLILENYVMGVYRRPQ